MRRVRMIAAAAGLVLLLAGSQAFGQYFGMNKVRYDKFAFKIMKTPHFDIYYYPEEREGIDEAARMAERWYERHTRVFGDSLHGRQPLIIYGSHPQFEETNVLPEQMGQGVGGVTEPVRRRIILPFAASLKETDHVIGHELTHAFQYDITGRLEGRGYGGSRGMNALPTWFIEGMAEYLSIGNVDANTAMWIRDAARNNKLPSLHDLNNPEYFPYRYGQALLAYIAGRYGDRAIGDLLVTGSKYGNLDAAIDTALGIKADSLISAWHAAVHAAFDSATAGKDSAGLYGPRLIKTAKRGGGSLNVGPAVSPDGREMVVFSERDLFSINLYLVDAHTGKIERTILHTELNPHYQTLEFISSAGAWSPDGTRFAFTATDKGRPFLSVMNVKTGDVEEEHRFATLGEIYSPTWSPDGREIAFSALAHGVTDLYVFNLDTGELKQLTNDQYTDLQPAWSPDGRTIAFVTDRFTTNLKTLTYGDYELATIDVPTGAVTRLWATAGSKNINPQWSPDGKELYFLADPDGITNIYRLDLASRQLTRITDLPNGVSGITDLSPALSVAARAGRLAYSVFEQGGYSVYAIDSARTLAGRPFPHDSASLAEATLPPAKRPGNLIAADFREPLRGLPPADTAFAVTDYHTSLSLEGVVQPTAAVGVDPFGTYGGGGVSLLWGDMLGNVTLATGLSIASDAGYTDIAGLVGYLNSTGRVDWGAVIQQTPYTTGYFNAGVATINGEDAYAQQAYIQREIDREALAIVSYPFSQVFRTELSAGLMNISFSTSVITQAVSLATGAVVENDTQDLPHSPALNLGTASLAFVFDNSIFGATDPLLGQRWRVQFSPTIGTLRWNEVLADFREYLMPIRPFTLAGRLLHVGRYGRDAENPLLTPLYLGYPGLVRGYDFGTFGVSDSTLFSRTVGSRILVANAELRFPLFGVLGLGQGYYGFLPIEVGPFYDTGVAWSNGNRPGLFGGGMKAVSSTGFVARINLFGLVGEVDFVRPLQHLSQGWLWEFNLTEGI